MEERFESYDWLKAIGSMLFFVAALLPWWTREYTGFEFRQNGYGDWLGIVAAVAILAVGLLTVLVKTESLPIPRWVINPTWMLALGIVGVVCVGVRVVLDPFGGGDVGIRDSRSLGLYLAGGGAVLVLIGCVMAFQHRVEWTDAVTRDDEDDDQGDGLDHYGYDADEQDELIRRINQSMERRSDGRRGRPAPEEPQPTVHQQRKAERAGRTAQTPPRRRRPTGPPIP